MSEDHDSPEDRPPWTITDHLTFGSPRFARLVNSPAARRVSPRRLAVGVALGFLLLWGLFEIGTRASRSLSRWVAARPEHQIPFGEIELDPPPPPFIRSGAAGLLATVRREAKYGETISVLDTDLEALKGAVSLNPWIERAVSVRSSYRHLTVQVVYRKPVALLVFDEGKNEAIVIDRSGVEMPSDSTQFAWVDGKKPRYQPRGGSHPLIEIRGLGSGLTDRVGYVWKPSNPAIPHDKAVEAARLAEFVGEHPATPTPRGHPFPEFSEIRYHAERTRQGEESGFFLRDLKRNWVLWKSAPGAEIPDEPTSPEKWGMLTRFIDANGPLDLKGDGARFLYFTPQGAKIKETAPVSSAEDPPGPADFRVDSGRSAASPSR